MKRAFPFEPLSIAIAVAMIINPYGRAHNNFPGSSFGHFGARPVINSVGINLDNYCERLKKS